MSQPDTIALTPSWLVLDKPPGWLTIPGREKPGPRETKKARLGVLSDWAKERYGEIWTVHRLDRDTSGVILFARTSESHRQASLWFQNHEVKKTYDCLATGVPAAPVFKVNQAIGGSPSITQFEVKATFTQGFLAKARPHTGRRHQIRIHLANQGNPLWGDPLYRGPTLIEQGEIKTLVGRVALHAFRLELPNHEAFESAWPEDFSSWVEQLKSEGINA